MLLSEYDIEYHTQKSHQLVDDYQFVMYDFPDEDVMFLKVKDCDELLPEEGPDPESRWSMIFDGVVNAYVKELVL